MNTQPKKTESSPRIVCLSHDSIDMLSQLGAQDMVVGRPAGESRPEVAHAASIGGYGSIKPEKIKALHPDLVIAYASFQAGLTAPLLDAGVNVLHLTHHSIADIFGSIHLLGRFTGRETSAKGIVARMNGIFDSYRIKALDKDKPRVYFEEWDEPMVAAPRWVSEMIDIAGGEDVFADKSESPVFAHRTVQMEALVSRNPEIMIASWCGKPVRIDEICARKGIENVAAISSNRIFEVPGDTFLQPGPNIVLGIAQLHQIFFGQPQREEP
ncbi:MAG: ABC transporter substrate-binding protein [Deltaproteobacteria bacterium]|nr:ABC transporter substrate-binding protein [Deltaproteobacteria bacterium]